CPSKRKGTVTVVPTTTPKKMARNTIRTSTDTRHALERMLRSAMNEPVVGHVEASVQFGTVRLAYRKLFQFPQLLDRGRVVLLEDGASGEFEGCPVVG